MILYVMRHAKAERDSANGTDFARKLAARGHRQVAWVQEEMVSRSWKPEVILASPLRRAQETAQGFDTIETISVDWMACGARTDEICKELKAFPDFREVMLVGHQPDLSFFVESIIGARMGSIEMKTASVARLELDPGLKTGVLTSLLVAQEADL